MREFVVIVWIGVVVWFAQATYYEKTALSLMPKFFRTGSGFQHK
ncbi:MAG: hypothetical protein RL417_1311 [Pseudomonadota bacterium]|jgi:hypothetical protein